MYKMNAIKRKKDIDIEDHRDISLSLIKGRPAIEAPKTNEENVTNRYNEIEQIFE